MSDSLKFYLITDLHHYAPSLGTSGKAYEKWNNKEQKCLAETGAVITLTTLKQEFGEPKDQVITYLTSKDGETLQKNLSTSAYIRSTLVLLMIAILTLLFAGLCYEYKIYRMANESQLAYTETVIGELPDCEWEDGNPPGDAVLPTEESTTTETTN